MIFRGTVQRIRGATLSGEKRCEQQEPAERDYNLRKESPSGLPQAAQATPEQGPGSAECAVGGVQSLSCWNAFERGDGKSSKSSRSMSMT